MVNCNVKVFASQDEVYLALSKSSAKARASPSSGFVKQLADYPPMLLSNQFDSRNRAFCDKNGALGGARFRI